MSWAGLAWLCAGSVGGGCARVAVSWAVHRALGTGYPYGTLIVNLSGCLLVGAFTTAAQGRLALSPEARLLAITGFCGAFTTLSAMVLESSSLLQQGAWPRALSYALLTVAGGFVFYRIGSALGELL
ncbi:MAG: putative fluoride ion transporter CrcB [Candidatus Omnitrophica bacterium]|nr:putative fluoride ion transporter CrcB [Candidatus Omnitrophota bacterium]